MAISFVGSSEQGVIDGGSMTVALSSNIAVDDYVVVAYSVPRSITMVARSSAGTNYTQLISTLTNGNLNFAVFGKKVTSTTETTVTCSGTGNAQDGGTAVAMCFRGVDIYTPIDTTLNSTIGTSTTPDSPSVTLLSTTAAVISAVGSLISDTTVTAPTSFLNQTDVNASDTRSTTTGQAWVTQGSDGAFNPTSWTNFTSAAWAAATIVLRPASTFIMNAALVAQVDGRLPDQKKNTVTSY